MNIKKSIHASRENVKSENSAPKTEDIERLPEFKPAEALGHGHSSKRNMGIQACWNGKSKRCQNINASLLKKPG